eukprot:Clim_evm8s15 gene=Clim_evmTU8s15
MDTETVTVSAENLFLQRVRARDQYQDLIFRQPIELYQRALSKLKAAEEERDRLRKRVEEVDVLQSTEAHVRASTTGNSRGSLEAGMSADIKQRIDELNGTIVGLYKERDQLTTRLNEAEGKIRALREELAHVREQKEDSDQEVRRRMDEIETMAHTISILQDEKLELELQSNAAEKARNETQQEHAYMQEAYTRQNQQLLERMNEVVELNERVRDLDKKLRTVIQRGAAARGANVSLGPASSLDIDKFLPQASGLRSVMSIKPNEVFRTVENPHGKRNDATCLTVSADGLRIVTGGDDRSVRVLDCADGYNELMKLSRATQTINCVDISLDSQYALGASNDRSIQVWHLGKAGRHQESLTGHAGEVYSAQFAVNVTRVVSASHDRTIRLWDLHRGQASSSVFSMSTCRDIAITDEDGRTVIGGHYDGKLRLYDFKAGDSQWEVALHPNMTAITGIDLSSDGNRVVEIGKDGLLHVVDVRNDQKILFEMSHPQLTISHLLARPTFSPDGRFVAIGGHDGNIYVFNALSNGKLDSIIKTPHAGEIMSVKWNDGDGTFVSLGKKELHVWRGSP